jgi:signal transduction histidine kinase
MSTKTIARLLMNDRDKILAEMRRSFRELSDLPYKEVLLNTEDGRRRLSYWVDLAVRALDGETEAFYADQTYIGYRRAVEGYSLADVAKVHKFYMKNVLRLIRDRAERDNPPASELLEDIEELSEVAFEGIRLVAQSFIATREEIIAEQIGLLQQLYAFTQTIMNTFEKDEIANLTTAQLIETFGAEGCHLAVFDQDQSPMVYRHPPDDRIGPYWPYFERAWRDNTSFFLDPDGTAATEPIQGQVQHLIVMPIQGRDTRHGVVGLFNLTQGIKFTEVEQELLQQFLYITAMVMENSNMVEEIERNSRRLRLLTRRTIDISEQERKRLSEDIHDTLTQTLTGISYKLQFCHNIGCKHPDLLEREIGNLVVTTRGAIDQSRQFIASLHPDIIDNIGLVSALERLASSFESKRNIGVDRNLTEESNLPSRITICLYRVAQEALNNVFKHAAATRVELTLQKNDECIQLTVVDNGKGFDAGASPGPMVDAGKYGLFYMQQRVEHVEGRLTIKSTGGRTEIRARIPLNHQGDQTDDHQNTDCG